jgi:hypothetical protein
MNNSETLPATLNTEPKIKTKKNTKKNPTEILKDKQHSPHQTKKQQKNNRKLKR